ncbi:HAD-like superfamily [Arabidopsis thaliana x Arabidopsis arenosa]|uniref:5'-nucleotidase n=1 Tax=Arabidopsis thaliana x Arabidopsis arenosa TaxID=1240361 RepID=A0A8T2ADI2_9BRAS|nr:HAD-like superfamily [Arabidopsis thaliana x Arabidopsis arenosa]
MRVISFWTRFHAPSSIRFSIVCHNHPQTHSSCNFRHDVSLYLSPSHSQFQWKNSQTLSVFSLVFSQNHQMEPCELSANTVIAHPRALTDKITLIRDAGPSKFQVIADFDATLTRYRVNGLRRQTSHGLLQQGNAYYDAKRQALYDHYHPLEISPVIPIDEKTKLMEEWWSKTHELLIEGGLTYDAIKKSVANSSIAFREGVTELFEFLEKKEIPVLIFSAGLADVIEEVLRQNLDRTFKNVKIVSNRMVFNDDGQLVSFKGNLIHVLNKNEHALDMAAPLHDRLGVDIGEEDEENVNMKERRNVLLMGDHLGDLRMSDGLDYETRISIGFLNDNIEKSLESYRESFDLVYLNDAPMWGALELVSRLFSTEAR